MPLSAESVRSRIFAPIPGEITSDGPARCTVRLSAESVEVVTRYIAAISALTTEFDLEATDEVRQHLRTLGTKLSSA